MQSSAELLFHLFDICVSIRQLVSMKILAASLALLFTANLTAGDKGFSIPSEKTVERISFGSCHRTGKNAQIWEQIAKQQPQLFIFTGDNIYADTHDPKKLKADYQKLNQLPEYKALKQQTDVIATWDDHDFGINDEGRENPIRKQSRDIMLDAFDIPADAPVRSREGVYQSFTYGSKGKRLQIILLDTRYFRSPLKKEGKVYLPSTGKDATLLGEQQWKWLESELTKPADLRLIVSSIQVLNSGHRYEKWANMPDERDKLLKLLQDKNSISNTLIISGDRHFSEFSKKPLENKQDLWEVTSSGLSNAGGGWGDKNPWLVGKAFNKRNFGHLSINWETRSVSIQLIDTDGKQVREQSITFP